MTFFKHLMIAALAALSLSALAQEAAIRKTLAERLPNLPPIEEVSKTPFPGVWEVRLSGNRLIYSDNSGNYIFTHSSETLLLNPNAPQMFDDKGSGLFSTVLLDWIEWEGPLQTDEEKSRRTGVVPPDNTTADVITEHLQRFAERAWRRPVSPDELAHRARRRFH